MIETSVPRPSDQMDMGHEAYCIVERNDVMFFLKMWYRSPSLSCFAFYIPCYSEVVEPPKTELTNFRMNTSDTPFCSPDHSGNGGIRGILLDGDTLVATGYTDGFEGGCLFINEEGAAMLWTFDLEGNLKQSKAIDIDTRAQGARVNCCCLYMM